MKDYKVGWRHSDNHIGSIFIDITKEDAYEILEGKNFDWVFPVHGIDKNGIKSIVGNINVNIGDINND